MWKTIVLSGALLVLAAYLYLGSNTRATPYHVFASPDGRFEIVVYCLPTWGLMPGQSGDARGFVRLLDRKTRRVLAHKEVEMVQLVDQVDWSKDTVAVKLIAQWDLPP